MTKVEIYCFTTSRVIIHFRQGSSVEAKVTGWKVIGEYDIHMDSTYHPTDYELQRGKTTFTIKRSNGHHLNKGTINSGMNWVYASWCEAMRRIHYHINKVVSFIHSKSDHKEAIRKSEWETIVQDGWSELYKTTPAIKTFWEKVGKFPNWLHITLQNCNCIRCTSGIVGDNGIKVACI